jgi:16S rRNA (uracil1498-N3)-methyltransferase
LPEEEAAHLARVLRLRSGDAVRVFDGRGHEWQATVAEVGRGRASVQLGDPVASGREPGVAVTLAAAVLKADHMDAVIRDAVMLGVRAVVPLLTEHTEVTASTIARGARIARWQRIAIASAKQCGRAVVPPVHDAMPIAAVLASPPIGIRVVLVEPAAAGETRLPLHQVPRSEAVELVVGPEGGWSPAELHRAAESGGMLVTLGAQTIRAVSAPLVAISALRAVWGDL